MYRYIHVYYEYLMLLSVVANYVVEMAVIVHGCWPSIISQQQNLTILHKILPRLVVSFSYFTNRSPTAE